MDVDPFVALLVVAGAVVLVLLLKSRQQQPAGVNYTSTALRIGALF